MSFATRAHSTTWVPTPKTLMWARTTGERRGVSPPVNDRRAHAAPLVFPVQYHEIRRIGGESGHGGRRPVERFDRRPAGRGDARGGAAPDPRGGRVGQDPGHHPPRRLPPATGRPAG